MSDNKNQQGFSWLIILLILILLGALGYTGYKVYKNHHKAKPPVSSQSSSSKSSADSSTKKSSSTAPATTAPTADELDNIKASITSGNTAALEGYMASSVNVVIAASEAAGAQTPTEAINQLSYINPGGTNTWDFALPAATLSAYQTGAYKQYFPASALVGKSSDGHVVSFQFDSTGKISGIFMALASVL